MTELASANQDVFLAIWLVSVETELISNIAINVRIFDEIYSILLF